MSRAAAKATALPAKAAAAVPPARGDVTPAKAGANDMWRALSLRTPDGGRPLDAESRAFFGNAFGRDFGDVRVHDDARADALARSFGANAVTTGHDITFARGQLAPHTTAGRALLAHELTHVVQQQGVPAAPPSVQASPVLTCPGDPAERAAEAAARAVAAGRAVPGGVLGAAPATQPTIARDVGTGKAGAILDESRFWQYAGRTAEGTVYSKLEYEPEGKGELGEVLQRKRLIHDRHVVVETAGGIRAHLVVHGVFTLPFSTPDAPPLQMLDAIGKGYVSGTVYVTVKRGAMRDWFGFDFFEGPVGDGTSMRATAASGGRYLHFGLTDQEQVDALMDEVSRRLPPRAKKHDTISDEDFKRLTRDEKAELARDAIGDAIELSNVVKTILIGLALGLLAFLAILAAAFAPVELAIALLAAFVVASIVMLVYLVKDAIADFVDRFTDNDIVGGILGVLKTVAEVLAVGVGAIAVGLAVFAAIVGAPFEAAGLVVLAIVLAVVAVGIALYQAYRDYQSAADAKDLDSFRKHTNRSARAIEGAIAAVVTAAITAGIVKAKGYVARSRSGGGGGPTTTKPAPPPPNEPTIIEPPQVAPAAPPLPEVPQVAPPGPVIPEVPQVAGPTIMKPNVTSPAATAGGDVVVDLPPGVKIVKPPKGSKAPKPPKPPSARDKVITEARGKLDALKQEQAKNQAQQKQLHEDISNANDAVNEARREVQKHTRGTREHADALKKLKEKQDVLKDDDGSGLIDELQGTIEERRRLTARENRILEALELERPPLRQDLKDKVLAAAKKTPDGKYLDANTGEVIHGDLEFGHVYGREHRRLALEAAEKGMTQSEFNDWVNSHSEWFQVEKAANNRSHRFEKAGID